jgi:FkbM family methyltransferase
MLSALRLKVWRALVPRMQVPGTTVRMFPVSGDAAARSLMEWRPGWKSSAISAILALRRGSFIDVGANVGQTLIDFLQAPVRSTYLGFEPNILCYGHVANLIAANAPATCRIVGAGLSDRTGVDQLFLSSAVDAGATALAELRPAAQCRAITACYYCLDDILDALPEPEVALVKLDIEGGELAALRGMTAMIRSKKPWILCEVLHRDAAADAGLFEERCSALMQLIRNVGYEAANLVLNDDASAVTDLRPADSFPLKIWNSRSQLECEYLFVPAGEMPAARRILLASEDSE